MPYSPDVLEVVKRFEQMALTVEQLPLATSHIFHAGMYIRTIRMPAETVLTGAQMRVATLLILSGSADVMTASGWYAVNGYAVLPGSAGRKQVIHARETLFLTMVFPTKALTVEEAEREFTDEYASLMSRNSVGDTVLVTGE